MSTGNTLCFRWTLIFMDKGIIIELDKLEFVEQYFEICYNQLRILEFIVHQYFYKKVLTFTLRHSVCSVSGGGKIENAD